MTTRTAIGRTEVAGMSTLRTAVLFAATLTTGLSAGLFYSYACSVMPGLARLDDRGFVEAMQRINVAILNGWFMLSFLGSLVLILAAGALHLRGADRGVLLWIGVAAVCYIAVLAITAVVNVPLNDRLAAATSPEAARAAFETTWVRWNTVRALTSTAALASLAWALHRAP
ncbi:DUF1772 domain-containing protein [Kitasatospora terrestris]|uniref:DUF1772 domain-containing protein n=1 Tax=Kitasatospora terrestris TaxID=258051 RepID=A0ABP9DQ03_9ACTN